LTIVGPGVTAGSFPPQVEAPDGLIGDIRVARDAEPGILPCATDEEFPGREPLEELEAVRSRSQDAVELAAAFERETGRRVDCVVRAFLGRGRELRHGSPRQDGRNAQRVDEGGGGRAASQLALARVALARPGAEAALRHQVAAAGEQAHPEQLAPAQARLDDLLPVSPRRQPELRHTRFQQMHGSASFSCCPILVALLDCLLFALNLR